MSFIHSATINRLFPTIMTPFTRAFELRLEVKQVGLRKLLEVWKQSWFTFSRRFYSSINKNTDDNGVNDGVVTKIERILSYKQCEVGWYNCGTSTNMNLFQWSKWKISRDIYELSEENYKSEFQPYTVLKILKFF